MKTQKYRVNVPLKPTQMFPSKAKAYPETKGKAHWCKTFL